MLTVERGSLPQEPRLERMSGECVATAGSCLSSSRTGCRCADPSVFLRGAATNSNTAMASRGQRIVAKTNPLAVRQAPSFRPSSAEAP